MIYADFTLYREKFLTGKEPVLDIGSFDYYARKATLEIKRYTGSNIDDGNVPEDVKMCCCEIAEIIYIGEKTASGKGIASENVGGWSVSYETSETLRQSLAGRIRTVVYDWLGNSGYLYRGV